MKRTANDSPRLKVWYRAPSLRESTAAAPGISAGDMRAGRELGCEGKRTSAGQKFAQFAGSGHAGRLDGHGAVPFTGKLPNHWQSAITDLTAIDFLRSIREPGEIPAGKGADVLVTATPKESQILEVARRLAEAPECDALRSILRRQWAELDHNPNLRPEARAILATIKEADLLNK